MRLIDADALKDMCVYASPCTSWEQDSKLIDLIDAQPTIAAPRWVRCEERLPDDTFKQVLITDGTHFGLAYCLDLGVYGVKWRKTNWMSIGGLFRGKITHWMPIEPPKEEEHGN